MEQIEQGFRDFDSIHSSILGVSVRLKKLPERHYQEIFYSNHELYFHQLEHYFIIECIFYQLDF